MARYKVMLESVTVKEGQGFGEGALELRVGAVLMAQEQELGVAWPSNHSYEKVGVNATFNINRAVGEFSLNGTRTFAVNVEVEENDTGINRDDHGTGSVVFQFDPAMQSTSKSISIPLYRYSSSKALGLVSVKLRAERLP